MSAGRVLKPYKKDFDFSYAFGAFATYELITAKPRTVVAVYIHSAYNDKAGIEALCAKNQIPVVYDDKSFSRVCSKENVYVMAVFGKYSCALDAARPHIALVNPGDMGNLGTIIRTMAGLNLLDLAIVTPAADIYSPKTVRASMGALFRIRFEEFESFNGYLARYPNHACFPFMLDGGLTLGYNNCPQTDLFTLIFGNEATGLPKEFSDFGVGVRIPCSEQVDSFNLSIAAGIGMFQFAARNNL